MEKAKTNKIFDLGIDFSNKKPIEIARDIFIFFITFCIFGWIFEVLLFIIEDHIIVNRGVLFGPWLPIYGVGGMVITLLFFRTKNKQIRLKRINIRPVIIYLESCIFATMVELVSTYIMAFTGGNFKNLWDYSNEFLNFQGRIALIPDLKFGFAALFAIYIVQPVLKSVIESKKQKTLNIFTICIFILFITDVIARIWLGNNFIREQNGLELPFGLANIKH